MRHFGLSLLLASLPVATVAAPTCTQPNVMPALLHTAPYADPSFVENAQLHGTALLAITLPKDGGNPQSVDLVNSSGYPAIDRSALLRARKMAFSPERRDCAPVGGHYLISVEY